MSYFIPDEECLTRGELERLQIAKFRALAAALPLNAFYSAKFEAAGIDPSRIDDLDMFRQLPFTTKSEITADQEAHAPYGTNLSFPLSTYTRIHRTSGTTGTHLRWLDTPQSWAWIMRCWGIIYAATGIAIQDRIFFPFSFGPFIGFWAAFESAAARGNFVIPGGGMTTSTRLEFLIAHGTTVVCCTPTYALRMAQCAAQNGVDLAASPVRALIVAGEPGGSIPEVRKQIESAWGARVFDHTGMTEVGSLGIECIEAPGSTHLIESECIVEVMAPQSSESVPVGEFGELVLTPLGRTGSPLIRYRTGDRVRLLHEPCACGRTSCRMDQGILGRLDDMLIIRGNNVYPSTIENIVRGFRDVVEYRVIVRGRDGMNELQIEVELAAEACDSAQVTEAALARALQDMLLFRPIVRSVAPETLPRFELKANRIVQE